MPVFTDPDRLLSTMELAYNNKAQGAAQRLASIRGVLVPDDHPTLPPYVHDLDGEQSWDLQSELHWHEELFQAYERGEIDSLSLSIQRELPQPLQFPPPGREEWKTINATSLILRIVRDHGNDTELRGQAEFLVAPADDRWYIVHWQSLPELAPTETP
jgi:hypothetical protein